MRIIIIITGQLKTLSARNLFRPLFIGISYRNEMKLKFRIGIINDQLLRESAEKEITLSRPFGIIGCIINQSWHPLQIARSIGVNFTIESKTARGRHSHVGIGMPVNCEIIKLDMLKEKSWINVQIICI